MIPVSNRTWLCPTSLVSDNYQQLTVCLYLIYSTNAHVKLPLLMSSLIIRNKHLSSETDVIYVPNHWGKRHKLLVLYM
jgi:hypothetical protein